MIYVVHKTHTMVWLTLASFGLVTALGGCGDNGPDLVPVQGTVTLDGKPLPSASVTFHPTESTQGQSATGITDDSGHFKLKIRNKEGVVQGSYRVAIIVLREQKDESGEVMGMSPDPDLRIPPKYNENTTLTAEVVEGEEKNFDFNVSLR